MAEQQRLETIENMLKMISQNMATKSDIEALKTDTSEIDKKLDSVDTLAQFVELELRKMQKEQKAV